MVEIKPDNGEAVPVAFTTETMVQRIAPGEKDLKSASPIKITDVAMGDRVLVSLAAGSNQARRIVVMSATDIAKRNEADTQDWTKRGIAGIVASKSGNQVILKTRSLQGETQMTVTANEKTKYRRYAPDSVRFVDAKMSSLAEVSAGDQLRARGKKSDDGLRVDADEVVFGTFLTKAGTITAIDVEGKQITVKDMVTSKPLAIHLTADSQLKAVPDIAAMMGARGGQGRRRSGWTEWSWRRGRRSARFRSGPDARTHASYQAGEFEARADHHRVQHEGRIERRSHSHHAALQRRFADSDGVPATGGRPGAGRGDMMSMPSMGMGGGGLEGLGHAGHDPVTRLRGSR